MRLFDMRAKEVINVCDCQRLGFVCDVIFEECSGKITHIVVPGPCKVWGIWGREEEFVIPFSCICQIGDDIILVEVCVEDVIVKC